MGDNSVILEGRNLEKLISEAESYFNLSRDAIKIEILEEKKSLFMSYFKISASYVKNIGLERVEKYVNNIENDLMISEEKDNNNELEHDNNNELEHDNKEEETEVITDSAYEVTVTADAMEAYLIVYPPIGGKEIDKDNIYKALEEKNIQNGIIHEEIEKLVNNKLYNNRILVAKGEAPIEGTDAYLEYHFNDAKDKKALITDDGKINFKELSLINNVVEGDLLVTIIPATKGVSGINILGQELQARSGKNISMPKGKNVNISEDGLQLISMINGEVRIINDKVNVFPIYTVDGNVDNSTGNIKFLGKVIIKGNVLTGFEIEADEDVEVFGVVEGANIYSKGNIILHRGMQGMNKGELTCEGDLIAKFIENSKVYAKGNVQTDAIMHSTVYCGKKLEVKGKKGLIVGGETRVSEEIKAKIVGSPMATITEIEVGINPDIRKKYEDIRIEYDKCTANLTKLTQVVDLLTKLGNKGELPDNKKALLSKSIVLKLQTKNKVESIKKEIQELEIYIEDISKGKIKVESIVYPGTKITIGSNSMYVKEQIKYVTFYRAFGEVKIAPFE